MLWFPGSTWTRTVDTVVPSARVAVLLGGTDGEEEARLQDEEEEEEGGEESKTTALSTRTLTRPAVSPVRMMAR